MDVCINIFNIINKLFEVTKTFEKILFTYSKSEYVSANGLVSAVQIFITTET